MSVLELMTIVAMLLVGLLAVLYWAYIRLDNLYIELRHKHCEPTDWYKVKEPEK